MTQLLLHIAVFYDRTRYQLREHHDVHDVIRQLVHRLHLTTVGIQNISDGLEGEEGDTDGQHNLRQINTFNSKQRKYCIEIINEEIGVFKIHQ